MTAPNGVVVTPLDAADRGHRDIVRSVAHRFELTLPPRWEDPFVVASHPA